MSREKNNETGGRETAASGTTASFAPSSLMKRVLVEFLSKFRGSLALAVLGLLATAILGSITTADAARGDDAAAEPIRVESVLIRLMDEVDVPARASGALAKVSIREGDRVEKGRLLAQVEDADARIAKRKMEIGLEIARKKAANDVRIRYSEKALEVAKAELRRSKESVAAFPKSVSQSQIDLETLTVEKTELELEQARTELDIERFALKAQENELEAAEHEVRKRRIESPLDGVVVEVLAKEGQWVEPGDKVARIVRTDRLRAEGFVPAESARRPLEGTAVELKLKDGGANETFRGRIVFVSPEIDPVNRQVRVWAEIENKNGRLRPGDRGELTIGGPKAE